MGTKRIIPCLDIHGGRVVKGVNFENIKDAGDPAEIAARYDKAGADELVFLDITASMDSKGILYDLIKKIAANISIPFTVGGGIKSVEDFSRVLEAGADKVSMNSAALKTPELISQASECFGSHRVVVAIDAKKTEGSLGWRVYINGGKVDTGWDVFEWAEEAERLGAGEILLTSMDGDGTKDGYDIELIQGAAKRVNIPIIASGGAGNMEHFYKALTIGGADAALAASLFHYKHIEIGELKKYLKNRGVEIRI